jgi:hypothetical protein
LEIPLLFELHILEAVLWLKITAANTATSQLCFNEEIQIPAMLWKKVLFTASH